MSLALSPGDAAELANIAYRAYNARNMADFVNLLVRPPLMRPSFPGEFKPLGDLIEGRTGLNKVSHSAVVFSRLRGGETEKAVTIRGTDFASGQDWMTNFNIGMVPGPGGFPCHAGFYRAYSSLCQAVRERVGQQPRRVHVAGHSLGGAMATMMAADLTDRGHEVYLYTFGAPRCGSLPFVTRLSRRLPEGRMFRVYDPGDPVPMIPLFPFVHAPPFRDGYRIGATRKQISTDFHSITDNYVPMAGKIANWTALKRAYADVQLEVGIAYWLSQAGQATRIPGAGAGLWALGRALEAILLALGVAVQTGLMAGMTVLDRLAWALHHASRLAGELRDQVITWVRLALRWLGREIMAPAAELTRTFLRHLLEMFLRALANSARRALSMLDQRPRA